ncbi:MAG: hypothetical protein ABI972_15225 [Acidobacteriota bacterium]
MRPALFALFATAAFAQRFVPVIPKVWDEEALRTMELPLATPGASPVHISAERYYAIPPLTVYKTYPFQVPGRSQEEYFAWLREQEPATIRFDSEALRTKDDWIRAGKYAFETVETYSPEPRQAGSTQRIVIREKGKLEFSGAGCAGCHERYLDDGTIIQGAQENRAKSWKRSPVPLPAGVLEALRERTFPDFATPWLKPDPNLLGTNVTDETLQRLLLRPPAPGPRFGSSVWSPVAMPDLIGVRDRKYLDRTGLVQHRDIGDFMRYAAINMSIGTVGDMSSYAGFVPHDNFKPQRRPARYSDEQLYALALYVYSLEPPKNPNPRDAAAVKGEAIFRSDGCGGCHPAPLYTNNKLTPAPGFKIPEEHKKKYDILPVSVGTDPWLTMKTRRGTGYYKVPTLKGVWYRGPFEHNGSVLTLEDWFDAARLRDDYLPTGWLGPNETRAVKGHEFGLKLKPEDKAALIAFLKTL